VQPAASSQQRAICGGHTHNGTTRWADASLSASGRGGASRLMRSWQCGVRQGASARAPAAGRSATNLEIGRTCSSRDSEGIFNLVHGYYRYTSECYKLHTAVIRKKRILTRALKLIEGESTQSGSGDAAVGILLALARWLSWLAGKFFLLNPGSVSTLAMHLPFFFLRKKTIAHSEQKYCKYF